VFPGVDIAGSVFYIQFIPTDDGSTKIEFGWGGTVNGPRDVAKTAVGAFGQELVSHNNSFKICELHDFLG